MQRPLFLTFASFVEAPENRPAFLAVHRLADCACLGRSVRGLHPLYLHGQTGTGKTHLVSALVEEVTRGRPNWVITMLSAGDLRLLEPCDEERFRSVRHSDFLVVEDLQHLPSGSAPALERIFDDLHAHEVPLVFTSSVGPKQLPLPARLTSRFAGGLVVGLEPLPSAGRLAVLAEKAQQRQLAIKHEVLSWLAEHLIGGGRQLDGALTRLESLTPPGGLPLELPAVVKHFSEEVATTRPTLERIARKVGNYFRTDLRQLCSEKRARNILLPRQVSMYLARQLTPLSFEQIGTYFGGRDHSTVLHACRKIEHALTRDVVLSGTVRQLYLDLA